MKFLIAAVLFFVFAVANCRLALNKTPKTEIGWGDTCGECQTIIKRIVEVAKDPVKVAELKMLLSALCRETHYEEECRLFVSKIDLFLDKLLPYLKDAHHVCQELRMCGNSRLEQFHRVGMFYALNKLRGTNEAKNSLMCEECKFAAHELRSLVEDPNVQQDVQDWVQENVCARMGSYKDMCDQYLEEVLPEFFQELDNMLADANKFCEDLELCPKNFATSTISQNEKKVSGRLLGMLGN